MSASPADAKKSQWSEYKNSEGRVYWSHSVTKQSVWEKPDELKTPFERALSKTQWRQYISKDRPYYVNTATKETKWDLPPELKTLKKRVEDEEAYKVEKARRQAEGLPSPTPPRSRSPTPDDIRDLKASAANALTAYGGPTAASPQARSEVGTPLRTPHLEPIVMPPGGFLTHAKAEEGFIYLLKREGVDEHSTWDQTMRKIIMDPLYKALGTLAEKKAAFEKYTQSIVDDRRAAKEARIMRLRPVFHRLFASTPEIKSYSTMKTAEKVFARERIWHEGQPDERSLLLEEYVDDLRQSEQSAERELRTRNVRVLSDLIRDLEISVSTRWRAAHDIIVSSDAFKEDKDLQKIETIDILGVYDNYARQLEQEHEEESRKLRIETVRKARKARDGFKALLAEMQGKGELTRLSKWRETYPKIKNDERYLALLGLQGSSPIDLWMDAVDDLAEETERAAEKLERVLNKEGKEITLETQWDEVDQWIKDAHVDNQIDEKLRKDVYGLIHGRLKQAAEDEARRADRRRRHRIDDLRYALKKVQRHIDLEMTYAEAEPHMKDLQEFKEVSEEEDRRAAFDRFVKRQKEKLREAESSEIGSTRGRDDRDRHRERERERESGRDDKERRHSTAKPSTKEKEDKMDIDEEHEHGPERKKDRRERDSGREKEKEKEKDRDRSKRDDRERERDRERAREHRDHRDRDKERDRDHRHDRERERERERDRDRKHHGSVEPDHDREYKRRRMSSTSKKDEEVEEGEI